MSHVTCTYDSDLLAPAAVSIICFQCMEKTRARLGQAGLFCSPLSLWQLRRYKQYWFTVNCHNAILRTLANTKSIIVVFRDSSFLCSIGGFQRKATAVEVDR